MMRYALDRSDKKRSPCPNCGRIGTWRPYVDTSSGNPLGDCGICDRENNCGYHRTPRQHFADLGQSYEPEQKRTTLPPPKRTNWRCPDDIVAKTRNSGGNHFAMWLVSILGSKARESLRMYRVGTYPSGKKHPELTGAMVYWQIGSDGRPRSGKVVAYDQTGHRRKDIKPSWMHSIVTGKSMDEIGCAQCLFGEHLLDGRPGAPVAIVEAEKTAIIASCFYPDHVWLAAGGSHGLALEKCMCLSGRDVTLFPDQGQFDAWSRAAIGIEPIVGRVRVSDLLEAIGADDGIDIGDLLISDDGSNAIEQRGIRLFDEREHEPDPDTIRTHPDTPPSAEHPILERMMARNPSLYYLCSELDLDTSSVTIYLNDQ